MLTYCGLYDIETLHAYHDAELDSDSHHHYALHVSGCADCHGEVQTLQQFSDLLNSYFDAAHGRLSVLALPHFWTIIHATLQSEVAPVRPQARDD